MNISIVSGEFAQKYLPKNKASFHPSKMTDNNKIDLIDNSAVIYGRW